MKHSNIYFIAAIVCVLAADTAVYTRIVPIAIIMYAAFTFFTVKLMFYNNDRDAQIVDEYRKTRRIVKRLLKYLEDNRIMTADEIKAVTEQKDKPRGNIRPGSRPSIEYMNLRVEKEADHDTGSEDQESA